MPDYLRDTAVGADTAGPVNFAERGIQLSRYARAIKIWLSLNYFGLDAFRATIDRTLDLTLFAEKLITASDAFEILTPARLGIVCFRRRVPGAGGDASDEINNMLVKSLMDSGLGMVSSTRVNGVYALRLCILTYRTTEDDVARVIDFLATAPVTSLQIDRI
jgi:glutamate/tyrosine decarboxylase-like PLP-dependent enzyme